MVEEREDGDLADTAEHKAVPDDSDRATDVRGLMPPTVDLQAARRDSSPFILLAEPKPQPVAKSEDQEPPGEKPPARTSYIPVPREVPVVVRRIQNITGAEHEGEPEEIAAEELEEIPDQDTLPTPASEEEPEAIDDGDIEELPEVAAAAAPAPAAEEEPEAIDDGDIEELPEAPPEAPEPITDVKQAPRPPDSAPAAVAGGAAPDAPAPRPAAPSPVEPVSLEDRDTAPRPAEVGAKDPVPDLGTPEMVFDALPAPGAEAPRAEDAEEIDLDGAEELTDGSLQSTRAPLMRRRHKQKYEWWGEIFDDDYLSLLPPSSARSDRREIDFLEKSLAAPRGSLLLDLACGSGRHAVGLARRGYRVVGIDLSLPMLARAGELAQEHDQKINFVHGDMRELNFDKSFDGVYCIGTSFGYFDDATNYKVIEGVARALKPGAPFLLEVANRDHVISRQPNLTWFEGNGSVCMEETSFNYLKSRLHVTRQLIMGSDGRQVKHELSVRLYCLHELGLMLHRAGFVVNQVTGHIAAPGAFFGADSALIYVLASRPKDR